MKRTERIQAVREHKGHPLHGIAPPKVEIIISLVDGFVWVCWPGTTGSVRLGNYEPVIEVMRDFLAQCELGERLANGKIAEE